MLKSPKRIFFTAICFFILTLNVYSLGTGVQISAIPNKDGINGDIKCSFRLMKFPVVLGSGFEAGVYKEDFTFGLTESADYWIIDTQLHNTINLYAAPGIGLHVDFNKDFAATGIVGLRAIIGINKLFYDNYMELYAQAGVEPGLVIPFTSNPELGFNLGFPCEIGLRFHY